jgi:tripeptidyl-peptidase I
MLGHKGGRPPKRRPHNHHIPADLQHRDVAITPACIKALYGVPNGTLANPSNAMGIFEEGDYYSQEDLNNFFANFTPYIPQGTHPKPAFIDGAEAPVVVANAGGESDVDFELAYPVLWPQGTVLFQTDDINYATGVVWTIGAFNTFLDAIDGVSLIC